MGISQNEGKTPVSDIGKSEVQPPRSANEVHAMSKEQVNSEDIKNPALKEEPSEKILVDKAKLEEVLKRMERLEATQSKARLDHYDNKYGGKDTTRKISLRTIDGKIITSWDAMPMNKCEERIGSGSFVEEQTVCIHFATGESQTVDYVSFARNYQLVDATIESESKDEQTGDITLKVVTNEGDNYEVDIKFVN